MDSGQEGVIGFLDSTAKSGSFDPVSTVTYPVVKVRPLARSRRRRPCRLVSQRSAGRWARVELTDQGIRSGRNMGRRLEDQPSNRRLRTFLGPEVIPGSTRAMQFVVVRPRSGGVLRIADRAGGDEETRTPDPLLAKETLCRLSYVPEVWWAFLDSNQRPLPYQGSALTS